MKGSDLLIVIDMQNVYKEGEAWGCCNASSASTNIRRLIDSGVFGEDVVFTKFLAPKAPLGSWADYNRENAAINADPYLNDMMEEFKPYLDKYKVLEKSTYSSFEIPELIELAEAADHVVLCGVVAECCVLSTALSAIDKGYPVIYISDAVSGLSPLTEAEAKNIVSYLSPIQTRVMTTEEYLESRQK